jgi:predicted helicase
MIEIKKKLLELYHLDPVNAGRVFERFVKRYLEVHPFWRDKFEKVWLWSEYPERGHRRDTGIDLVAVDQQGRKWAIQVKFYTTGKIGHREISTFIATATGNRREFQKLMLFHFGELTQEAEKTLFEHNVAVVDILKDGEPIDWSKFSWELPNKLSIKPQKELRPYQRKAVERVKEGFQKGERGKLIMAPGTGKTFVALKIAEEIVGAGGVVLFLVPSIALADQTLRSWVVDSSIPINPIVVTSDRTIGKGEDETNTPLLSIPPTTDPEELKREFTIKPDHLNVVISTYQSIEVLERAQKEFNFPQFDLIISDEAHYTTGVSDPKKITTFKKVHSNRYVEGKRRLYMTATPKIFNLVTKRKAKEEELVIYDMGDTSIYGPTFFEYTFYKAVQEGFLTDYRVIVFTISEKEVQEKLFDYLQAGNATLEETAKIFGTLKVLEGKIPNYEKVNIKRGVIFVSKISRSKRVEREFPKVAKEIDSSLNLAIKHIDGSMPASHRQTILEWLREGPQNGESVRVLTNAKVLTEGIDVPSLDSVVFFDPRKSTVDIVQAMGRIMRKAPNKRYGYLVIPVVVESDKPIEEQLASNRDFQTIWQLATALRTLDESFTARIRRLSFKKVKEGEEGKGGKIGALPFEAMEEGEEEIFSITTSEEIDPELKEAIKKSIIPKIVEKVGGRKYLESWAKDVAKKVTRLRHHIDTALTYSPQIRQDFEEFLTALREVINPSITPEEAKSLLIQHLITKPIFEALFGEYNFLRQNPVAQTIEQVASHFTQFLKVETEDLEEFYREVQIRAQGIDERERQEFLRELYDSFFKTAFPDIAEKLGIVYTPIQLVDFLISSVEEILKGEFQTSLNNPDTTILEPFAGTATFVARLLQFLELESLKRKYSNGEIWANELLLLAYYIGLANVQSVYFEKSGEQKPFKFFLLTDTFQLYEKSKRGIQRKLEIFPPEYTQLMERETREPINVIISNPPWRAGQRDMTDLNMSEKYPLLDKRIKETYVDKSTSKNKNALYDSYVRAIRFASDRIGEKGVIAFVLNNGFIDANSFDGFRKSLVEEFKKIYVFNLRGNARTRGEEWQKEGGKIFGQGSRAGVALLFLVKDKKEKKDAPAKLYYYQVPDALKREEKLK